MTDNMLEYRMDKVELVIQSIAESLQSFSRLEVHHTETRSGLTRAFQAIEQNRQEYEAACEKVDVRLRLVELQLPIIQMTSRWVIGGTIAIVSGAFATFGLAIYALLPIISKGS